MGFMDSAKKKAAEFLGSEQGEQKSDQFLDKAEQAATDRLGEDKAGHVRSARDAADERLGAGGGYPADPADRLDPTPGGVENPDEDPLTR